MKDIKMTYKPRCSLSMKEQVANFKEVNREWYEWFDCSEKVWHLAAKSMIGEEVNNYTKYMKDKDLGDVK